MKNILTKKRVSLVLIILLICLISLALGYAGGRSYKTYEVALEKAKDQQEEKTTSQQITFDKKVTIPNNWKEPKVNLSITKLGSGNYNLNILPTSFFFTPESFGGKITPNSGFATVSLNGKLLTQAYGKTVFLSGSDLKNGENKIEVFLNANDGSFWFVKDNSKPISTSTIIVR